MSTKVYQIIAINRGHDRFDVTGPHSRDRADAFLESIGHKRHAYLCELSEHGQRLGESEMLIFANESGTVVHSVSLALDMSLGGKRTECAARASEKLLALAYNDQCLTDYFQYYEKGALIRAVANGDGFERSDVTMEGDLLPEEIEAVVSGAAESDDDPDAETTEFVIDGKAYTVQGFVPMIGCSLKVAERLGAGEWVASGSVYSAKPWWKWW